MCKIKQDCRVFDSPVFVTDFCIRIRIFCTIKLVRILFCKAYLADERLDFVQYPSIEKGERFAHSPSVIYNHFSNLLVSEQCQCAFDDKHYADNDKEPVQHNPFADDK